MRISNRVFCAAVFLMGCAIVSRGADSQEDTPEVISAHRFEVIDATGLTRAVLTAGGSTSGTTAAPRLDFFQTKSERRLLCLGLGSKDAPSLVMSEPKKGKALVHLEAIDMGEPALTPHWHERTCC